MTEIRTNTIIDTNPLQDSPRRKREKLPIEPVFSSAESSENDIDFAATNLPAEAERPSEATIPDQILKAEKRIKELALAKKLFKALDYRDNEAFERLLKKYPGLADQINKSGQTLLEIALSQNNQFATKLLLESQPFLNRNISATLCREIARSIEDLRPLVLDLITRGFVEIKIMLPTLLLDPSYYHCNVTQNAARIIMAREIVATFEVSPRTVHSLCNSYLKKTHCYYSNLDITYINRVFDFPEGTGIRESKCDLL